MKAALLDAVCQPLALREVPTPTIGAREVLVQTRTCGICGTDLHIIAGHGYVPDLPHILGHEPAGVVAAVGAEVTNVKVGDRVIPSLFFTCDECYYCRVGRNQQCAHLRGILGVLSPGAFAEYFKVPAQNAFHLPDSISFETGGLIADAVVTAVHASRRGGLVAGSTGVVIGAGGVGLCLLQMLVASGVRVAAVDVDEAKLEAAQSMGAAAMFLAPQAITAVREWAGDDGVQGVFDCVGSAATLDSACRMVMNGGRVVVIGEQGDTLPVTSTVIAQRELEIIGSRNGTRQDLVEGIRLVAAGAVRPPIAARYALADINQAMQRVREGVVGRVVVQVSQ
ncbi:MAG: alcohol dehydrogenase catalytic domain-containing protein [Terriglobales bacterium]